MAAAANFEGRAAVDDGPRVALLDAQARRGRRWRRVRPAPQRSAPSARSSRCDGRASSANISCSRLSARSVADAMRPSVSISSGVEKRTAFGHRLPVPERLASGCSSSGLALSLRHLDEEAEDIVVAHLQRLDAGRSMYSASSSAITPRLSSATARASSSSGSIALAHEAAVAAQLRRIVDERAGERGVEGVGDRPQTHGDAGQLGRQAHAGPVAREQLQDAAPRPARRARHRDRVASRVRRRGGRPRAQDPARTAGYRAVPRAALLVDEKADGIEPRLDLARIAQWAREAPSKLARAGSRNCAVDGAEQASLLLARSRAGQFQARAARGIDEQGDWRNRFSAAAAIRACVRSGSARHTLRVRPPRQARPARNRRSRRARPPSTAASAQLPRPGCRSRPSAPALPPRLKARSSV